MEKKIISRIMKRLIIEWENLKYDNQQSPQWNTIPLLLDILKELLDFREEGS